MNILNFSPAKPSGILAIIAMAALPLTAGIVVDQYASPYVSQKTYVDFGASSIITGHQNFSVFPTSEHYLGRAVKYFDIAVSADRQYAPLGRCYEITTSAPAAGVNVDTEILVKLPNNNVWQKLSDDYNGTLFSKARFWFGEDYVDPTTVFLRVGVHSTGYNTSDFYFMTSLARSGAAANLPVATEAECFADVNVAAAFVDRHENVTIRRVK